MKRTLILVSMVLAAPLSFVVCMLLGPAEIGWPSATIHAIRLGRVANGFVVGAGLACAGVVLQALLRNPLAEPYLLGVSSGAGLGAGLAILAGLGAASPFAVPGMAFLCSTMTLLGVYALAHTGGRLSIYGLILSGVIVSSICSSILMFLVSTADVEGLHNVLWWMLGNLQAPPRALFAACGALALAGIAGSWILTPELDALSVGRDMAHHAGVATARTFALGLLLATLTSSACVSMAGLIGFVGLIVPHAVRHVVGPRHRVLIPMASLVGGSFLALCDALARTLLAPREIPVGVVTALVGGPFFLFILFKRRREAWAE
jgi:iron complex transport system permease protein